MKSSQQVGPDALKAKLWSVSVHESLVQLLQQADHCRDALDMLISAEFRYGKTLRH